MKEHYKPHHTNPSHALNVSMTFVTQPHIETVTEHSWDKQILVSVSAHLRAQTGSRMKNFYLSNGTT